MPPSMDATLLPEIGQGGMATAGEQLFYVIPDFGNPAT